MQPVSARPVFRFAPSPNGYLHLGHALSALLNHDSARAAGGRLLLRIEDIDGTRYRPEYEAAIYEDLEWLGIEYERPVRRQSEHFGEYRAALERLARDGLVYPAFESRAEIARLIAARGPDWLRDPDGTAVQLLDEPQAPARPAAPARARPQHRLDTALLGDGARNGAVGGAAQQAERLVEIGLADTVRADEDRAGLDRQIEAADGAVALDGDGGQGHGRLANCSPD